MKFGRNLLKVIELSDPAWAAYFVNYKFLKKLLKKLHSEPADDPHQTAQGQPLTEEASLQRILRSMLGPSQNEGDHTAEKSTPTVATAAYLSSTTTTPLTTTSQHSLSPTKNDVLGKHPLEVAFFRFLHSELQKSIRFYDRIQEEYTIRVERLVEGSEILQNPDSSTLLRDRWSVLARSAYNVYKDLLLLQNYAIMTYCSFSKILKKHDKMTSRTTRNAFMTSMVDRANFADTSRLEQMVQNCEDVYSDACARLFMEGRAVLGEDERLFLNMVSQMNNEAVVAAEEEGAPNANRKQRRGLKGCFDADEHRATEGGRGVADSNKRALLSSRNQSPSGRSTFSSSGDEESTTNEDQDRKLPASGDSKNVNAAKQKESKEAIL